MIIAPFVTVAVFVWCTSIGEIIMNTLSKISLMMEDAKLYIYLFAFVFHSIFLYFIIFRPDLLFGGMEDGNAVVQRYRFAAEIREVDGDFVRREVLDPEED